MAIASSTIDVNPKTIRGFLAEIGKILLAALGEVLGEGNVSTDILKITLPPNPAMGDFAYGCFYAAKGTGQSPVEFAKRLDAAIRRNQLAAENQLIDRTNVSGPYVNFFLNRQLVSGLIMRNVFGEKDRYGANSQFEGRTVMVEFLAPNTNKPLHIGHLRNGVIGTTVANLLAASGARVIRANNINDRGIHIIQSMLAYGLWGNGETPQSTGEKGDHFVGRYYVKFHQEVARLFAAWLVVKEISLDGMDDRQKEKVKEEFQKGCALVQRSYEMLSQWEDGNQEIMVLWDRMNQWVYDGFNQTNSRVGFLFDIVYYESRTYKLGRQIIVDQFANGVGGKTGEGAVVINLTDVGLGSNPISLIRKDGTSLYITQDIGLAVTRFNTISGLSDIIYVVAKEQEFHFRALFEVLRRYGYAWHSKLRHLSYGMVNLPSGKMKSREGRVVDADDLVDELHQLSADIIRKGEKDTSEADVEQGAEAIAIGALKYMLAAVSPRKDILFDPEKSVDFNGNTGPYIQYACVRIAAIEEKASGVTKRHDGNGISDEEFSIIKMLGQYPDIVQRAAAGYDPSALADGLYYIAKAFSSFYTRCPVVYDGAADVFRLNICKATSQVLKGGLRLLGIPVPRRM